MDTTMYRETCLANYSLQEMMHEEDDCKVCGIGSFVFVSKRWRKQVNGSERTAMALSADMPRAVRP
jgi:hypothetical protein